MGDWLAEQGKKLALSIAGTVAVLVWWTITGTGGSSYEELSRWPATFEGGGANQLRVEVALGQPGRIHAVFDKWESDDEGWDDGAFVDLEVAAGEHTYTTDFGPNTTAYLQLSVEEPEVGAKIAWKLYLDDELLHEEEEELTEPLDDGYAFFLNYDFEGTIAEYAQWLAERER